MFLPKDIRCIICSKIFCCVNCRKRHQNLEHMEKMIASNFNKECPICNGLGTFILHKVSVDSEKLLEHIIFQHLPMQCKNCFKFFDKKSNFIDGNSAQCRIVSPATTKSAESPGALLETIPEIETNNKIVHNSDPLVANNSQEKRLSVDSAFSLRNVSSIMKIDQSTDTSGDHTKSPGKKLVRTTSTPMQETFLINLNSKHTPDLSSGGHVMMISSINNQTPDTHSCSGNDLDNSHNPNNSSSFVIKKPTVPNNPRNKILLAATPLRQVMSKSIQRAIQEHGIKSFNEIREYSSRSHSDSSIPCPTPLIGSLNLRTTLAIPRSESKYVPLSRLTETNQNLRTVQSVSTAEMSSEVTTISPTNLSNDMPSAYETCKTSTGNNIDTLMTPKVQGGGVLKKTISFTSIGENTPIAEKPQSSDDSESDIWFTPTTVLTRSQSCSILEHPRKQLDYYDDVFIEETTQPIKKKLGLWSLVTKTVMHIKSFGSASLTNHLETKKETILPEYDDHSENNEPPYVKRRKLSQHSNIYSNMGSIIESNEPRRRKILCRPAISRMQK